MDTIAGFALGVAVAIGVGLWSRSPGRIGRGLTRAKRTPIAEAPIFVKR